MIYAIQYDCICMHVCVCMWYSSLFCLCACDSRWITLYEFCSPHQSSKIWLMTFMDRVCNFFPLQSKKKCDFNCFCLVFVIHPSHLKSYTHTRTHNRSFACARATIHERIYKFKQMHALKIYFTFWSFTLFCVIFKMEIKVIT